MTAEKLREELGGRRLTQAGGKEVTCGCVCDLLSWVMSKGEPGMAWVTVQTHMNVIAVAALHDMAAVIVPSGVAVPEESVAKAEEEGIAVIGFDGSAYDACARMAALGIRSA